MRNCIKNYMQKDSDLSIKKPVENCSFDIVNDLINTIKPLNNVILSKVERLSKSINIEPFDSA